MTASGQNVPAAKIASAAPIAAAQRALLGQYCVTCHNDKTKIDNFSLQKEDINAVGDRPEVWERVIRKLRAGMMPPPGMPRPPLAKYEGLRDFLETEIDRKAAAHPNPGSIRTASSQPNRIRQRRPRPAGSSDRCLDPAAGGRFGPGF